MTKLGWLPLIIAACIVFIPFILIVPRARRQFEMPIAQSRLRREQTRAPTSTTPGTIIEDLARPLGREIERALARPAPIKPRTPPERIERWLDHEVEGNLVYNAPQTMRLQSTVHIKLLMSPTMSAAVLTEMEEDAEHVVGARIQIAPRMRAQLVTDDPSALHITASQTSVQPVSSIEATAWIWSVRALKRGTYHMTLSVSLPVKVETASGQMTDEWWTTSYQKTISVTVTFWQFVAGLDWKWFLGIILAGLVVPAIWRYLDRRRKASTDKSSSGDG